MSEHVTIGVTDLSIHRITGSLIAHVLTDMGFTVHRIYSPHRENFRKLCSGEVDMLASAWLPSNDGEYMFEVQQTVPLIELGLHYLPYAIWGVPDYVPMDDVAEVSDLLKPGVQRRMRETLRGINPGAGITRFSMRMMLKYGLIDAGYSFLTGTEADCLAAFERSVRHREWTVVPLWKPQFLHCRYRIRELRDPKGLLGLIDRAVLLLREDRQSLFSEEQLQTLDSLHFTNDSIAELDWQVSRAGQPLDAVTRNWLVRQPQL